MFKDSGLLRYLFGKDRTKTINLAEFCTLQRLLKDDILYLEFGRYDKDFTGVISDLDFCHNIIYNADIPTRNVTVIWAPPCDFSFIISNVAPPYDFSSNQIAPFPISKMAASNSRR